MVPYLKNLSIPFLNNVVFSLIIKLESPCKQSYVSEGKLTTFILSIIKHSKDKEAFLM